MTALMGISIFMTLVFSGATTYYMYMIRILQLILHLPIFIIQAPANASFFCSLLLPVANFDLQIDWVLQKIFTFAVDSVVNFPFNFELIGYGNNAIA